MKRYLHCVHPVLAHRFVWVEIAVLDAEPLAAYEHEIRDGTEAYNPSDGAVNHDSRWACHGHLVRHYDIEHLKQRIPPENKI